MFDFTAFIRKKWSEYSSSSGQRGTAIDELAVKPAGLILADFYNTLVAQRRVNNIVNWESMSDEQMKFFGNKFFIPMIEGDYAFGSVRIYFDEKKNFEISTNTRFVSNGGQQYRAIQPGRISRNSFKDSDRGYALYYVSIPIIAVSAGNSYNIDSGEMAQIINIDFTYKSVVNHSAFINGSKTETAAQYYQRLLYSLNDRSMMNARSLYVKLPEFFPVINSIYIAGAGNRYMRRDLISGVDLSDINMKKDFLGKSSGDNTILHVAFFGFFPPNPGDQFGSIYGPHSIETEYDYPLTISPVDNIQFNSSEDPAMYGFPTNQEADNDMYRGLYFNDFKNLMEISTKDLFNIQDEEIGFTPVLIPDADWMYGSHGRKRGGFGEFSNGVKDIDVMNFQNNIITLAGGCLESLSVSRNIDKRTGVKLSGSIKWPDVDNDDDTTANSNIQIMVGGINDEFVDGYTGIGFGIRVVNSFDGADINKTNAVIYFAHNEKYGTAQVFAADNDINNHISVADIGSLAEKAWRIEPGIEYDFEFIVYDNLRLALFLYKTTDRQMADPNELENEVHFSLPEKVLHIFSDPNRGGILAVDSVRYGTMMKVTLDTQDRDPLNQWVITDLKAVDTCPRTSMAMMSIDVAALDGPVRMSIRASGNSGIQGGTSDGYWVYIWDSEKETSVSGEEDLTKGAWAILDELSDPMGKKSQTSALLFQDIQNLDRYRIRSQYGESVFILIRPSGKSIMKSRFEGSVEDDVYAYLGIDYIKLESLDASSYHANNKVDIYLTTIKNTETIEPSLVVLTKQNNESFFIMNSENGCKMPVVEIISITAGADIVGSDVMSKTDYISVQDNSLLAGSAKEELKIVLENDSIDMITVEYRSYPQIEEVQTFFDSSQFEKIYGDILIRHQSPVHLSFSLNYTGNTNDDQMVKEIRKYVDINIDSKFSIREMVNYLYNQNLVNNVHEPITISYIRTNEDGQLVSGSFTDVLEILPIEFFRLDNITVSKIS